MSDLIPPEPEALEQQKVEGELLSPTSAPSSAKIEAAPEPAPSKPAGQWSEKKSQALRAWAGPPMEPKPLSLSEKPASVADQVKEQFAVSAEHKVSLGQAKQMIQERNWHQNITDGIKRSGLQALKGVARVPEDVLQAGATLGMRLEEQGGISVAGVPVFFPGGPKKIDESAENKAAFGPGGAFHKVIQTREYWDEGIDSIIRSHPEWNAEPPKGIVDLLTSPRKLSRMSAEFATQILPVIGLSAVGLPEAGAVIIYGTQREAGYERAKASGLGTEEDWNKAGVRYGMAGVLLQEASILTGIHATKQSWDAVNAALAAKIAHNGAEQITHSVGKQWATAILTMAANGQANELIDYATYGAPLPSAEQWMNNRVMDTTIGTLFALPFMAGGYVAGRKAGARVGPTPEAAATLEHPMAVTETPAQETSRPQPLPGVIDHSEAMKPTGQRDYAGRRRVGEPVSSPERDALVKEHQRLFRGWEEGGTDETTQSRIAQQIQQVRQKIDALDGVSGIEARAFVPPETRTARAQVEELRQRWQMRGRTLLGQAQGGETGPDYVSLEPEQTEYTVNRPKSSAEQAPPTPEEIAAEKQEQAQYDSLMARIEANPDDQEARRQANDLVQHATWPSYDELQGRVQAQGPDAASAAEAIQRGRYRYEAPRRPSVAEQPATARAQTREVLRGSEKAPKALETPAEPAQSIPAEGAAIMAGRPEAAAEVTDEARRQYAQDNEIPLAEVTDEMVRAERGKREPSATVPSRTDLRELWQMTPEEFATHLTSDNARRAELREEYDTLLAKRLEGEGSVDPQSPIYRNASSDAFSQLKKRHPEVVSYNDISPIPHDSYVYQAVREGNKVPLDVLERYRGRKWADEAMRVESERLKSDLGAISERQIIGKQWNEGGALWKVQSVEGDNVRATRVDEGTGKGKTDVFPRGFVDLRLQEQGEAKPPLVQYLSVEKMKKPELGNRWYVKQKDQATGNTYTEVASRRFATKKQAEDFLASKVLPAPAAEIGLPRASSESEKAATSEATTLLTELRANRAEWSAADKQRRAEIDERNRVIAEQLKVQGMEAKVIKEVESGKRAAQEETALAKPSDLQAEAKQLAKEYEGVDKAGFKDEAELVDRYQKEKMQDLGETLEQFFRRIGCDIIWGKRNKYRGQA